MSDALAISGVSAVLQYYLQNMYSSLPATLFGSVATVSSQAPDLVQSSFGTATAPENQVNLFLHQVTYNAAWRNVGLPSLAADGQTRLKSPPLAFDLHYLLTVYGSADWQAEGLLGYALMMLHENPVMTRDDISNALSNLTGPNGTLITALQASGLADQIELIKITPATLGREEMAWLWTALKADYRPTFPFQVSVVLMQPQLNTSLALPVLRRRLKAQPVQPAQILLVQPPNQQAAAAFADTVTVTGEFLAGITQASLSSPRFGLQFAVPASNVTNTSFTCVPGGQTTYTSGVPPGVYNLAAQVTNKTGSVLQSTNTLPVALAPTLPPQTAVTVVNADGSTTVTVSFTPNVWEGQSVSLALSTLPPAAPYTNTAPAQPFTGTNNASLNFQFPAGLPSGKLLGRLLVDGVTSQVQASGNPPQFSGPLVIIP